MLKLKEKARAFWATRSEGNLYKAHGAVPFLKALPFSFEQVLVMFMTNLIPIVVVMDSFNDFGLTSNALQAALLWTGLGTILQLFPLWLFGSGLPIMMGTSFTFIGCLSLIAAEYGSEGYGTMLASALIGSLVLIAVGFLGKWWKKFVKPVVSATILIAVGLGLLELGMKQIFSLAPVEYLTGGLYDFSLGWPYILIAVITFLASNLWRALAKGYFKNLNILFGLVVGFLTSVIFNAIFPNLEILDFSQLSYETAGDIINVPHLVDFSLFRFRPAAILFAVIIFLVGSSESLGDVIAVAHLTSGQSASVKEVSGCLTADGLISAISCCFGSLPIVTSTENVGYMGRTGVVNREVVFFGALLLVLLSFFPPVSDFFLMIPDAVLGGLMLMIYTSVLTTGLEMFSKAGFTKKNVMILCLSLGLGYGTSLLGPTFFNATTFAGELVYFKFVMKNEEASMFLIALLLSYLIPEGKKEKPEEEEKKELEIYATKEEKEEAEEEADEEKKAPAEGSDSQEKK
jgi:uracil-xanthine permease